MRSSLVLVTATPVDTGCPAFAGHDSTEREARLAPHTRHHPHRLPGQRQDHAAQPGAARPGDGAAPPWSSTNSVKSASTTRWRPPATTPSWCWRTAACAAPCSAIWWRPSTGSITRGRLATIPAFDHVVIETSGLADPSPVIQAFLSEPTLAGLYRIGNRDRDRRCGERPGHARQTSRNPCARSRLPTYILLTKLDLVGSWKREEHRRPL